METNVGSPVSQAAEVPSPARLSQLITGFRITQAIYVAATLGIADLLAIAPRPVEEVARVTGIHASSLDRLLLMLLRVVGHLPLMDEATDTGGRCPTSLRGGNRGTGSLA